MTYLPTSGGTGGNVTATVDLTDANFGAENFPNSPNYSISITSTAEYLESLNVLNSETTVPSNAETT